MKYTRVRTLASFAILPSHYERDVKWAVKLPYSTAANRYTLVSPGLLTVNIDNKGFALESSVEISLAAAAFWDTQVPTDYTVAANRAGKDFYIYACDQDTDTPKIVISANSTVPSGYTASTSRKIGGFHCLCVAVGTIAGHTLTDFAVGDILPNSIWDLNFRPICSPEGMVYSAGINKWVDIYLASGTGTSTVSVYGGTISDTRNWMDFVDDGVALGKQLLDDDEFQRIATGSNEQTNITGSADPVTTGGHVDTAGRRMISNIGCEDCCGVMWQWLKTQSYRYDPDTAYADGGSGTQIPVSYVAAPAGNQVYLKEKNGVWYLCCNLATGQADVFVGTAPNKIPIVHDANANTGIPVYFDGTQSQPAKLRANIASAGGSVVVLAPGLGIQDVLITHATVPSGNPLFYTEGAANRLETANGAGTMYIDLAIPGWSYVSPGGNKGQIYKQGAYGDVKLLAGASWTSGAASGSRSRLANDSRWNASSGLGGRFRAEHRER